jgi:hypothetical protein
MLFAFPGSSECNSKPEHPFNGWVLRDHAGRHRSRLLAILLAGVCNGQSTDFMINGNAVKELHGTVVSVDLVDCTFIVTHGTGRESFTFDSGTTFISGILLQDLSKGSPVHITYVRIDSVCRAVVISAYDKDTNRHNRGRTREPDSAARTVETGTAGIITDTANLEATDFSR